MDRRKERRIKVEKPVKLTILGADPSGGLDQECMGTVLDTSGRGMRVELPLAPQPGAALRIDIDQQILFGEVCYCQPSRTGRFAVGLQIEQSLRNLGDLSRLVKALREETSQNERISAPH